ncbi:MAG: hypothetical protein JNK15_23695 [Planctomycetes bacterium]|nr:hypothetical protein [Planctomycetota bacterium]
MSQASYQLLHTALNCCLALAGRGQRAGQHDLVESPGLEPGDAEDRDAALLGDGTMRSP